MKLAVGDVRFIASTLDHVPIWRGPLVYVFRKHNRNYFLIGDGRCFWFDPDEIIV